MSLHHGHLVLVFSVGGGGCLCGRSLFAGYAHIFLLTLHLENKKSHSRMGGFKIQYVILLGRFVSQILFVSSPFFLQVMT
jgi:hypothetical protein